MINNSIGAGKLSKPRGRPLAFNQDEALEKPLQIFWLRGYEGTSMAYLIFQHQ